MLQVPRRKTARHLFYFAVVVVLLVILAGAGLGVYGIVQTIADKDRNEPETPAVIVTETPAQPRVVDQTPDSNESVIIGSIIPDQRYVQFTGTEFRDFYNRYQYPFVKAVNENPEITGEADADQRIRQQAEASGYQLRAEADEDRLEQVLGQHLQPEARTDFLALQTAAEEEGELDIVLVSGYRSIERQQEIFSNQISDLDVTEIATGVHDATINAILKTRSVPGYSRHHTGYTVDVGCGNYHLDETVADSGCFKWLSANNYENAKRFGFIPSYPEGAGKQGPEPEPWEYVWVGEDVLLASQYQ